MDRNRLLPTYLYLIPNYIPDEVIESEAKYVRDVKLYTNTFTSNYQIL